MGSTVTKQRTDRSVQSINEILNKGKVAPMNGVRRASQSTTSSALTSLSGQSVTGTLYLLVYGGCSADGTEHGYIDCYNLNTSALERHVPLPGSHERDPLVQFTVESTMTSDRLIVAGGTSSLEEFYESDRMYELNLALRKKHRVPQLMMWRQVRLPRGMVAPFLCHVTTTRGQTYLIAADRQAGGRAAPVCHRLDLQTKKWDQLPPLPLVQNHELIFGMHFVEKRSQLIVLVGREDEPHGMALAYRFTGLRSENWTLVYRHLPRQQTLIHRNKLVVCDVRKMRTQLLIIDTHTSRVRTSRVPAPAGGAVLVSHQEHLLLVSGDSVYTYDSRTESVQLLTTLSGLEQRENCRLKLISDS